MIGRLVKMLTNGHRYYLLVNDKQVDITLSIKYDNTIKPNTRLCIEIQDIRKIVDWLDTTPTQLVIKGMIDENNTTVTIGGKLVSYVIPDRELVFRAEFQVDNIV